MGTSPGKYIFFSQPPLSVVIFVLGCGPLKFPLCALAYQLVGPMFKSCLGSHIVEIS